MPFECHCCCEYVCVNKEADIKVLFTKYYACVFKCPPFFDVWGDATWEDESKCNQWCKEGWWWSIESY